ncbi:2415_t:CDS:10 [Paraglomus occultum]|uniref:2415_t:CDS:1 n=1 Tax=Paraglomus occultum TaxID=144539 RepID=A0A9N9F6T9_9GLOM|nr:2415_t:CDS:10 [Paraglomus occultum]
MVATKGASTSRGVRLRFKQKLVSGSSKQIATIELVKRLKTLHEELKKIDQEEVDTDSLASITKELINESLTGHKDKSVKAYVAACLADVLRLHAPDAPYTDGELRDVFDFFVRQLQNISDTSGPYFDTIFHLLETLSTVKIVLLILDLQDSDGLMDQLFHDFFDVIRPEMPKNVHKHMLDILYQLTEESSSLPKNAFKAILSQFDERKDENPAAYKLAYDLCNSAIDKLQRCVSQYFTHVIVSASEKSGASQEDLNSFKSAHDLIKGLNRSVPKLLLNVVPQLEEELKLDDLNLRLVATQVLGEMFAEKGSTLATDYDNLWKTWLSRRNDKVAVVRIAWADHCLALYQNHPELAKQINDAIRSKMSDPDEKVRIAFCKIFSQIDYESALKLVDKELLEVLGSRCRDRKQGVRQEAINSLARLYNLAFIEIADFEEKVMEKFDWIPKEILNTLYTNDNEIIACVEKVLHEQILPHNSDVSARVERMLIVLQSLDGKAKKAFFSLFQRQRDAMNEMDVYLRMCEKYKGGDGKEEEKVAVLLAQVVKRIAGKLPDPPKSINHLSNVAKLNDIRLYRLLRDLMSPESDYKTVKKAEKDVFKHIEQSAASALETFSILIRRVSLTIFNGDIVPLLLHKLRDLPPSTSRSKNIVSTTQELLKDISSRFPALYRAHVNELMRLLSEDLNDLSVENTLEALAKFSKTYPDETPQDIERLFRYAMEGTPIQARRASMIMGHMRDKHEISGELLQAIIKIALYSVQSYENRSDDITNFILNELILKNRHEATPNEPEWVKDEELDDECKAKVLGLKILVNRLIARPEDEAAEDLAKPVFKLLWTLIREGGEFLPDKSTSPSFQSRLRLAAAKSVLKLARKKVYDNMIPVGDFKELALMIQDPCYQVRHAFSSRLIRYCSGYQLSARFLAIFFLVAHEPEGSDILPMAWEDNLAMFEMALVRLIYLLSHHPDFSCEIKDLIDAMKYIDFFLDTVANADNMSFLYYIVGRLKQVQDIDPSAKSDNLYTLSDLAQHLIRERCKASSWTLLSFPNQVVLPKDMFRPLLDAPAAAEIMVKNYLPKDFMKVLVKRQGLGSSKDKAKRSQRNESKKADTSARKRRRADDQT